MAPEGYLHRVLADGARPFRYRCRIRELLGLTVETGIRVEFAPPAWHTGFVHLARSPGASESPAAPSSRFGEPAPTPARADSTPTPSGTQHMPPMRETTARMTHGAAVHNEPGGLARPLDAVVRGSETTSGAEPAGLSATPPVGPKSGAGGASRAHEAVPATEPTQFAGIPRMPATPTSPTVTVPGRTAQTSGPTPGELAPTDDATAIHNGPSPMSTGPRRIPIAPAGGPVTDTTTDAEGSSAPAASGDRAVRRAETRPNAEPAPLRTAAPGDSSAAGRPAGEPAVSRHHDPLRSRRSARQARRSRAHAGGSPAHWPTGRQLAGRRSCQPCQRNRAQRRRSRSADRRCGRNRSAPGSHRHKQGRWKCWSRGFLGAPAYQLASIATVAMSASTAIGMVSASLRNLLVAEMQFPQVDVTILAPDETGSPRRINLFLYRIAENPVLEESGLHGRRGSAESACASPIVAESAVPADAVRSQ